MFLCLGRWADRICHIILILLLSEEEVTQAKKITFSFDVIENDNLFIYLFNRLGKAFCGGNYQLRMWLVYFHFLLLLKIFS